MMYRTCNKAGLRHWVLIGLYTNAICWLTTSHFKLKPSWVKFLSLMDSRSVSLHSTFILCESISVSVQWGKQCLSYGAEMRIQLSESKCGSHQTEFLGHDMCWIHITSASPLHLFGFPFLTEETCLGPPTFSVTELAGAWNPAPFPGNNPARKWLESESQALSRAC